MSERPQTTNLASEDPATHSAPLPLNETRRPALALQLAESEAHRRWLTATLAVSGPTANAESDDIFGAIAAHAVRAGEADYGVVACLGPADAASEITAIAETAPCAGRNLVAMSSAITRALQTTKVVLDRTDGEAEFIAIALTAAERQLGVLCLGRSSRIPFSSVDTECLATYAKDACLAIELAQEHRQCEQDARRAERDRIAHALQSDAIIDLFGVGIGLQAMSGALVGTVHENTLLQYSDQLDDVMRKIRQTVFAPLSPPSPAAPRASARPAPESQCCD